MTYDLPFLLLKFLFILLTLPFLLIFCLSMRACFSIQGLHTVTERPLYILKVCQQDVQTNVLCGISLALVCDVLAQELPLGRPKVIRVGTVRLVVDVVELLYDRLQHLR